MVATLLVDVNTDGHGILILNRMNTEPWREYFDDLAIQFLFFADVGLDRESPDDVVWRFCQEHEYFLLTSNRNQESDDSLGSTIRQFGTPDSLPVFTLADPDRVSRSSAYLDKVIERLILYLWDRENYLGVGRLYLP